MLFIKVSIIGLLAITILYLLNLMYMDTNQYKGSMGKAITFEQNMHNEIEIINLGNSHPDKALIYENINGYNMAFTSQPFYYDEQILKQYQDRLAKNCVVLINVSYHSFYNIIALESIDAKYYWFLDKDRIKNYSFIKDLQTKHFPIMFDIELVGYIFKDSKVAERSNATLNLHDIQSMPGIARTRAKYFQQNYNAGEQNLPRQIALMQNIIEFCLDNGYRPVLFTTPYTKYFNDNFSADMLNEYFYAPIDEANIYDIPYLDYSHDPRFTDNHDLFMDSDHLNAAGREKFSSIILDDLKEYGLFTVKT